MDLGISGWGLRLRNRYVDVLIQREDGVCVHLFQRRKIFVKQFVALLGLQIKYRIINSEIMLLHIKIKLSCYP